MLRVRWSHTALAGLVCALLLGLGSGSQATGDDASSPWIYDVDFSSPLHTVGSSPTTGYGPAPRATPTSLVRGPVLVVDAYADLLDQPLAFPVAGWGHLDFSLAGLPTCPAYRLEMDVVVDVDLRIFLTSPYLNLMHFRSNGDVVVITTDLATRRQTTTVVASYTPRDGAVHHLVAEVDLASDTFELQLDGKTIYTADFGGQTNITMLRMQGTAAAVDDIRLGVGEEDTEIPATVDVMPGTVESAPINLHSRGVLPVALLSTSGLDAASVDVDTLVLSDSAGGEGAAPRRTALEDVDGDGRDDLVMHFAMFDLVAAGVVSPATTSLTLSGAMLEGTTFLGSDDVRVLLRGRRR